MLLFAFIAEHKIETESSITVETASEVDTDKTYRQKQSNPKNKYCFRCQREFSHRSAYLRHMRRRHQAQFPIISTDNHVSEVKLKRKTNQ